MADIHKKDLEIIRLMAERNNLAKCIPGDMMAELSKRTSDLYTSSGTESGLESSVCSRIADAVNESATHRPSPASDVPPMKVAIIGGSGKMGICIWRLVQGQSLQISV